MKICRVCKNEFEITDEDRGFYAKLGVQEPPFCPDCRFKRRAVYRNESTLYKRICALCNRSIITMYNPKSPYIVYCNDCWASDKWDPMSHGIEYDSSRPFFDQLKELALKVPKAALYSSAAMGMNVNSEYTNFAGNNKDCYLIFNSSPKNENCMYSRGLSSSRDTVDTYYADASERSYEGVNLDRCAGVAWGQNVSDCLNSWFLLNCANCTNCFGCVNLRNKSFCFLNEQLDKDEWKRRVSEIVGSYEKTKKFEEEFKVFTLKFPRRENNNFKSVDVSGDYVAESKNCHDCFEVAFSENLKNAFSAKYAKDSYDILGHGRKAELMIECVGAGSSQRVIGSWWVETSHDIEYSLAMNGGNNNCFGCDGLKNASYAVLNKKYSEEEYKKIREQIVRELKEKGIYGSFLPPALSFFAYNESISQDNMSLTKEEAIGQGFRWEDELPMTKGQETMKSEKIPDRIQDVDEDILKEIFACIDCERNYRLTQAEFDIYKKALLPIPRRCFSCRHMNRIKRRGNFTLHSRACGKCSKEIKTNYAPDRPEIVYCEACYQAEVV